MYYVPHSASVLHEVAGEYVRGAAPLSAAEAADFAEVDEILRACVG